MAESHLATDRYLVDPKGIKYALKNVDIIVVGGGIAGLTASIAAAEAGRRICLVTKDSLEESNSFYAQGGVAAVLHKSDSFDLHFQDTIRAGDGLSNEHIVKIVVEEGPDAIRRLIQYGSPFDVDNGELALSKEGGHSAPRVVHAQDSTGMAIQQALINRVRSLRNVAVHERHFAVDILTAGSERCAGVLTWNRDKGFSAITARGTILASGGAGQIYRESTNPDVATGDGVAMAFRAGAAVRDMEFFQFHPTVLYLAGAPRLLISETARGEGGVLKDRTGARFMPDYHPSAELAPRDAVSRAIQHQMEKTRDSSVYLDMTHLGSRFLETRFPNIREVCLRYGIDISRDLIPVRPAAHYAIGGVAVDEHGRTSIPGLYACGEAASSQLHGANRLGSNSLLEGVVFGRRAALAAAEECRTGSGAWSPGASGRKSGARMNYGVDVWDLRHSLRALMWRKVGIERDAEGLSEAVGNLDVWARLVSGARFAVPSAWELANMLTFARLVSHAARLRTESRGVHYRRDFPRRDDETWRHSILFSRAPRSLQEGDAA